MVYGKNSTDAIVCYSPTMITTLGIWQGDNPLDYSLPLFILQLTLIVLLTRILVFVLKPFRQPRVISEILAGIILGPSVMGRNKKLADAIFPLRSVMILETMANVGLLYFLFLVGVEMDLSVIRRTGKKALAIAVAGMFLPFLTGISFSYFLLQKTQVVRQGTFILFLGAALSVTAFPVLARILAELKLLNTEMGRIAMSSALVNDMCAWILLAFAIALAETRSMTFTCFLVIFSGAAFVVFCILVVRPMIEWIIDRTPEGENVSEFYICVILTGVMICGFITDTIGTHSVFGAFIFGLVIPNGPLGATLVDKLEDFVSGLLLPLFFAISGLKTQISTINGVGTWALLVFVIVLACAGKIAGTLIVAVYYRMPFHEGITLGILMNSKGLVEMIVLNVGKDHKVLDEKAFAMMVLVTLAMTSIITPTVTSIYKPARKYGTHKRRTIQRIKQDSEFKILACIHSPKNVPTIINLLETSNPSKRSPICAYVLHLVELTGRSSAILIVHNNRKTGSQPLNRTQAQSDHIINAFESFEQEVQYVTVQPLTAISPYSTMHEDICTVAEDKHVAFIIIPFHKQQAVDGKMEVMNPAFRIINQNLLANAPCSVGILVDRGFTSSAMLSAHQICHHVAMLFFGGPDDREGLAYAWKMSDQPGVNLTVMRFIPGDDVSEPNSESCFNKDDPRVLTVLTDHDKEKQLDDDHINAFREKSKDDESIIYTEKIVSNGEQTLAAIRSIDNIHDLFIVGRGQGMTSPLTAGLTDWSECPELGAIGDLLASSDFGATYSVLVIHQYVGMGAHGDAVVGTPNSPGKRNEFGSRMIRQEDATMVNTS
ncbi:cation/H(+) antiporter 15-like [Apium graveolens]|uniref:cation/H(+) antiporter 15-like n=1 Tax=Apium graveolens TaxID=4045 RepID=UPI003D7AD9DB